MHLSKIHPEIFAALIIEKGKIKIRQFLGILFAQYNRR